MSGRGCEGARVGRAGTRGGAVTLVPLGADSAPVTAAAP